jgi:DNA replication protein DnaC
VAFGTAAEFVNELINARDERHPLRLQRHLSKVKLLIIEELGFVPLSKTRAELQFELFSQRDERGSIRANLGSSKPYTSNWPDGSRALERV